MCGRYTLTVDSLVPVMVYFGVEEAPPVPWSPRFNLAPSQQAPVVRAEPGGHREISFMRWGLVPSWAKDISIGYKMINARSETAAEKPSFKKAFIGRRCAVPVDGFYEWKHEGAGKSPYRIQVKNSRVFALAGLWDSWRSPEGEIVESYTILTTAANEFMRPLHDRMPVILPHERLAEWLDPERHDVAELESLLQPYDPAGMTCYRVSTLVNSPKNDRPEVIEPA